MSMASRASFSDDTRMIKKPSPKNLLLRDYLRDDMSSCSSNGFRSYPRRQGCTKIRFLVEMDLNLNGKLPLEQKRRSILESKTKWKPKSKPKKLSVLQRASTMMINAFKHFPFSGAGNPRTTSNFWPRCLSRKLLKHSVLKKAEHNEEIKRLKSFGDFIKEKETSPPSSPSKFSTTVTITITAELNSSTSNSNIWSDSESTATTGNSSEVINLAQKDVSANSPENKKTTNGRGVGATTTTATSTATNYSPTTDNTKKWQNKQDEQFSPVSVMDFPCNNDNDVDDEDDDSSGFQHRQLEIEGTEKLMFKTRRFNGVSQLEPIKLEYRIAQMSLKSSTQLCYELDREENRHEKKAMTLLQLIKSTVPSHDLFKYDVVESLLLGFFIERMIKGNVSDYEMLRTAKDWMDGQAQEMVLDWESKKNREIYIRGMENWSKYDDDVEKENVGLELEFQIFTSLVDDILLDFCL